jgi:glycosyltransferase involved in cell wall biosynthesis
VGGDIVASVIFVTQRIDPKDSVLGFVPRWVAALAQKVDRVDVIANEAAPDADPIAENVRVIGLGKAQGASRMQRGLAFERSIWNLTKGPDVIGLVAHMCPIYLDLAFPITRVRRVPTLLWFAHPSSTRTLRLAEWFADGIVTSLPGAYPRPGRKSRAIGQAVDTTTLTFSPPQDAHELSLIAAGRTSAVKGLGTAVRAVDIARRRGARMRLSIVGPSSTEAERRHRAELTHLVTALGLHDVVSIFPGVSPDAIASRIGGADLLVNATARGSGDKVVFEAAALGTPALVSNPAFAPLLQGLALDLMFREDDPEDLADHLLAYRDASLDAKRSVAMELRRRTEAGHSLDHWASQVVGLLRNEIGRRSRQSAR